MESENLNCRMDAFESSDGSFKSISSDSEEDEMNISRSGNNSDSEENETNSDLEHGSGIDSYQKKILRNKREQQKFLSLIHLNEAKQDFTSAANELMTKKKIPLKRDCNKKVYDGPLRKSERFKDKERKNLCLDLMFAASVFSQNAEERSKRLKSKGERVSSKKNRNFDSDTSSSEDMSDDEFHVDDHEDYKNVRRSSRLKDVNTNYSLDYLFNHLYGPPKVEQSESTSFDKKMTSNKQKHFKSIRSYKTEENEMVERKVKKIIETFDVNRIESSEWPKVLVGRLPHTAIAK